MTQGESPSPGSADLAALSLRGRDGKGNLIIIGASARAAAQSAIRAGYSPWCIDLFADRDLQAIAPVKRCPREKWPEGILDLMHDAPPGPVLLTGAMENHIKLLERLPAGRHLLGGPGLHEVKERFERIREPSSLKTAVTEYCDADRQLAAMRFVRFPRHRSNISFWMRVAALLRRGRQASPWIIKPRHSAGGTRIRFVTARERLDPQEYVQQYVEGESISAVYRIVDGAARLVGVTQQIIGASAFGASGFEYVGNIGPLPSRPIFSALSVIGSAVAKYGELDGLFGIDAVVTPADDSPRDEALGERVHPIEVNPRYVASIEVIERATGVSVFTSPLRLSAPKMPVVSEELRQHGKAVVRAKGRCRVPDLYDYVSSNNIADVPKPDELFEPGQPICTVLAEGRTISECHTGLRQMAEQIYTRLQPA